MTKTVTVVGQGYVGLPLAMAAVEVGHRVVGVDVDERRVARLAAGDSFVEDISEQQLRSAIETGRYLPTATWEATAGSDIFVVTVPTPLREGIPDLSYVESAGREISERLVVGATVVLESTTYPGTTDQLLAPILEQGSGLKAGIDFRLGYSPERIDPSNKTWGMRNTPKVVSGIDDESLEEIRAFYASFVDEVVPVSSTRTAELTKLLENTFRHVNIALVNEIAAVAPELGVDIWEAIDAADSKPFGFMRFTPGPGVGGHCLPIDPSYLLWQVRQTSRSDLRMVSAANEINDHMPDHVVSRVQAALNRQRLAVNGAKVLLLGMAYKKNVGDIRESPSLSVARQLHELGAEVHAAEPHTDPEFLPSEIDLVEFGKDALVWADAVVVLTDHDVFDYELVAEHSTYVFDTRNRCVGSTVELL
ncbi:nucleotide sugar dehydrogenase [Nocardioides sp. JQ2195]|uniref:nucleotide sugar dehydrogenase n=1 Tax=Nocardioides sp. JQ2195 TaxID=2592334 RepID=UPI00143E76A3|nr:nucleotide sugar dehydrogenase [Nocardioides sp. JQ2195]QIX26199.1 nucleotide sugar dehydrogenase [Nocardioides sp. JQ2195]